MKEYRVYRNLTRFAITVKANSKTEAIETAKKKFYHSWDSYEDVPENHFYDAVCLDYGKNSGKITRFKPKK